MSARRPLLVAAAAVLLFALLVRAQGREALLDDAGHAQPMSADAWFYLDRTVASWRGLRGDGAILPSWAPGLSCPTGTSPPWPHGLNVGAALAAEALLPSDASSEDVRSLASWIPPLVGAASCALLTLWAGALFGLFPGLLAGLLLALLPIHVWNTAWSTLDHHIFAAPVPLLAIWGLQQGIARGHARGFVAAGVVLGLAHWCWTEAWFWQAGLVGCGLIAASEGALLRDRTAALRGVALMAVIAGVVALPGLLTAPYFVHDRVAPHAPGRFTLWANLGIAVAALSALKARKHGLFGVLGAAVLGALAVVAVSLVDPGMRAALQAAVGFAGRSGMVSLIDESKPLLRRDFPQPLLLLSAAIVVAPALPIAFSPLAAAHRWLLGAFYVVSMILALLQSRFALVFAVPFCAALAAVIVGGPWCQTVPRARWLRAVALLGASTVLLSWAMRTYQDPQRALRHAFMAQIAQRVGPPSATEPRPCLLAPWNLGHELLLIARQPVVAHNFTEHEDRRAIADADRFLFGPFAKARQVLDDRRVRMVWIEARDHADVAAHQREIGAAAARDIRDTAWFALLLGDREKAAKLGLQRTWTSPMAVQVQPGGPDVPLLTVPRDQLYLFARGATLKP